MNSSPTRPHTDTPQQDDRTHRQARYRRRRRTSNEVRIAVNLAPMIDVTFLLLIFFLVTTTFERAEGVFTSKLPRDTTQPAVALPISPVVVRLTKTDLAFDAFSMFIDRFENQPTTFDELAEVLREIQTHAGFDHETPVVIVADNDVRWDHVVGCWNAALRADCRNVAFANP